MLNLYLTQYKGVIIGPIAHLMGYILDGLYRFLSFFGIHNGGVCIIIFTFIINGLMIPLTVKQMKFSKLSAKMNPEVQAIQAKYKGKKDPDSQRKMQMETQAIYAKYGANPTSGCLPMLITIPIMFALWRVIYNIPAYVPAIKSVYSNLAGSIQATPDFANKLAVFVKGTNGALPDAVSVTSLSKDVVGALSSGGDVSQNYIIDILSQLRGQNWTDLVNSFPGSADIINTTHTSLLPINNFLGLNISDSPAIMSLSIIIPILAVVTQFFSTKLMTTATPIDDNNSAAASMKMMNNVMPLVSGVFCFMFPIGVGLYWIAGSTFRIIQAVFVNRYLSKIDVDTIIQKNQEKQKKKQEKLGVDPKKSIRENAFQRAGNANKSIASNAKATNGGNRSNSKSDSNIVVNKNVKSGSISGYANILSGKGGTSKKEEK